MENASSRIGPNVATEIAERIGFVGPNLSYSMPPTGAKNAPTRAPGSTRTPAWNALVPSDIWARLVMTYPNPMPTIGRIRYASR